MKFFKKMKSTLLSIRKSIKRFPITIAISTLLAILLIYLNESNLIGDSRENMVKVNFVLGLGIPLSLCIGLLIERFFKRDRKISTLLYGVGLGFLVLYYYVFLENFRLISMSRYIGTMLFLILAFFYIPRLKRNDIYEYYVIDVYSSFALTFIYSLVLYLGTAAILFTIDQLFEINIKGELYYYMFLIVAFIFAISLFLSKLPNIESKYGVKIYIKSLNVLLLYIVIPLITVYTGILYVYFAKILITRVWPRGLVSHLVLWYSTISVGVIFLITPILEDNKVAKNFKIWFPKLVLPVLLMMFVSIYKRIEQYGITENRYYGIALGLWVLGIMVYFSLKKSFKNIIIPISLSLVILNSIYGPLSSSAISKSSQNKRLEEILNRNNMIISGNILANSDIPIDEKREISNIINYFDTNYKLEDIKVLPEDFNIANMEKIIGFKYEPSYSFPYERDKYFYYGFNPVEAIIDISEYDYYATMSSWNKSDLVVGDLSFKYNISYHTLAVSKAGVSLGEVDLKDFVENIYSKQNSFVNEGKNIMNYEDMSFKKTIEDLKLQIIFNNINGRVNESGDLIIESLDFILLINNQ